MGVGKRQKRQKFVVGSVVRETTSRATEAAVRYRLTLSHLVVLLAMISMPPGTARAEERMENDVSVWHGRYARQLRLASSAKMPLLPTERSTTVSLLLVDLLPGAGEGTIQQHHRVCNVHVESYSAVQIVIPPAFVQGLVVRRYPALFRSQSAGWAYRADLGLEAIGFDPQETGGELPRFIDDPAVRDTDADGSPGATVELRVPALGRVQLFIAQRSHLVLHGTQTGEGRIEGGMDIRLLEQRTLGARPGVFNRTPAIRPDAEASRFILVRVAEDVTCEALTRQATSLFR